MKFKKKSNKIFVINIAIFAVIGCVLLSSCANSTHTSNSSKILASETINGIKYTETEYMSVQIGDEEGQIGVERVQKEGFDTVPVGMFFDETEKLCIIDSVNNRINKYDKNGNFTSSLHFKSDNGKKITDCIYCDGKYYIVYNENEVYRYVDENNSEKLYGDGDESYITLFTDENGVCMDVMRDNGLRTYKINEDKSVSLAAMKKAVFSDSKLICGGKFAGIVLKGDFSNGSAGILGEINDRLVLRRRFYSENMTISHIMIYSKDGDLSAEFIENTANDTVSGNKSSVIHDNALYVLHTKNDRVVVNRIDIE